MTRAIFFIIKLKTSQVENLFPSQNFKQLSFMRKKVSLSWCRTPQIEGENELKEREIQRTSTPKAK